VPEEEPLPGMRLYPLAQSLSLSLSLSLALSLSLVSGLVLSDDHVALRCTPAFECPLLCADEPARAH
jgi:hypothetical protein